MIFFQSSFHLKHVGVYYIIFKIECWYIVPLWKNIGCAFAILAYI